MRLILTSILLSSLFFACSDDDDDNTAGGTAGGSSVSIPFPAVGLLSVGSDTINGSHACVNDMAGVRCWGNATNGRLGNNAITGNRNGPTAVLSVEEGAGINGAAITLTAAQPGGQLADSYDPMSDLIFPLEGIEAIDAGGTHTCALGYDMGLRCWGNNFSGQVGKVRAQRLAGSTTALAQTQTFDVAVLSRGAGTRSTTASTLTPWNSYLYGVRSVSAGGNHTCAVYDTADDEGVVACWGLGEQGQLGLHDLAPNQLTASASADSPQFVVQGFVGGITNQGNDTATSDVLTDIVQVAAGGQHTCALNSDGEVYCWGDPTDGRLGYGTVSATGEGILGTLAAATSSTDAPVQVVDGEDEMDNLNGITQIVAGDAHTCALSRSGRVYCWGEYASGQLGLGSLPSAGDGVLDSSTDVPRQVLSTSGSGSLSGIAQLAAGADHTCALSNSRRVYCWGENTNGQLGTLVEGQSGSTNTTSDRPLAVVDVTGDGGQGVNGTLGSVVGIAAGGNTTCALQSTGRVVCWGSNANNALGLGATTLENFGYPSASNDSYQPVTVRANAFSQTPYDYGM